MTTHRELKVREGSFDNDAAFMATINVRGKEYNIECYVFDGREHNEDVYIMKVASCIKSEYTEADRAHMARLVSEKPVKTGDIVTYKGKQFRVRMLGNYSDAGRLDPV